MDNLVLIDGNSLVNRAFYALPPLINSENVPTGAVYGFATMLVKIIEMLKPKYIAVAFDLPKPTFRHKMYAEYKGTRSKMPDELIVQMPLLKDMLGIMNIRMIESAGLEADDIIGTMAKCNSTHTFIVTADKDCLQLIDDSTEVVLTKKGISEIVQLNAEGLMNLMSLTPSQIIDYKALAGDSSDNIPGVAGVGEKTATALLASYKDLDGVYANIAEIKGRLQEKLIACKDMALLSKALATIKVDCDIDCDIDKCTYDFPFKGEVYEFFSHMGFKSLIKRDELFHGEQKSVKLAGGKPKDVEIEGIDSVSQLRSLVQDISGSCTIVFAEKLNICYMNKEYIVNLSKTLIDNGIDIVDVVEELSVLFADESIVKYVFDAKNIMRLFKNIMVENYWDIKLAQYLVDMTIDYASVESLLHEYNLKGEDKANCLRFIAGKLDEELAQLKMVKLYYDIELPLVRTLFEMEQVGFKLDMARLFELSKQFNDEITAVAIKIHEISGDMDFNINSPKQLAEVLFDKMGIPYPKKSKTYSTGIEILGELLSDHEIIQHIIKYRFLVKLNSTYIEGLRKLADIDGVVHTEFKQTLTTTGRLSSAEPNLQNIPIREEEGRVLRSMFVARDGYTLVTADYSQIELRIMAHYSADEIMVSAYSSNEDIHKSTASQVFGVPISEVTPRQRREAKAVNFGIIYGISDYGLSQNIKIPTCKAKEYIQRYFEKFKGVKAYLDRSVILAKQTCSACTLMGRVRRVPELMSSNFLTRSYGERVAMNMPLQGTAADIIKIAMNDVRTALLGTKSRLILQVHDELIVETSNDEIELVKEILQSKMNNAAVLLVPLKVDVGVGRSLFDTK